MITEAGMDGLIANSDELPSGFIDKINISVQKHGSKQIFIVGHYDCGGHPVDEKTQENMSIFQWTRLKKLDPTVLLPAYGYLISGKLRKSLRNNII